MMDEYPQGCNALVAVISYTGYDMEDAMIINKAAYERGFGHGSVYKTFVVDLEEVEKQVGHNFTRISPQPVTTTRISPHLSPRIQRTTCDLHIRSRI
jgi:DNA-directed RNA polymerase beta subunit